jgi:hypothetical protein
MRAFPGVCSASASAWAPPPEPAPAARADSHIVRLRKVLRRPWVRRVFAVGLGAGIGIGAVAAAGGGVFATSNAQVSPDAPTPVSSGSVSVSLTAPGSGSLSLSASDLAPGDVVEEPVIVDNTGTAAVGTLSVSVGTSSSTSQTTTQVVTPTGTSSSTTTSGSGIPLSDVMLGVLGCSNGQWSTSSGTPTCSGQTVSLIPSSDASETVDGVPLAPESALTSPIVLASSSIAAGSSLEVVVVTGLAQDLGNSAQSQSVQIPWTFTATQAAGTHSV